MGSLGKALALLIVSLFLISVVAIFSDNSDVKAVTNYNLFFEDLHVTSPSFNMTYRDTMPLNCTLDLQQNDSIVSMYIDQIGYSIDNGSPKGLTIPFSSIRHEFSSIYDVFPISFQGTIAISNLSNGIHQLTLFANGGCNIDNINPTSWNTSLAPINFSVYNSPPPSIVTFSPKSGSYITNNVTLGSIPLNFSVDKTTSWKGYSLDNQGNVTLTGNSTLTGLAYGNHTLEIFANDTVGNMGASQTVNFSIEKPPPTETIGSNIIIAVIAVSIAIICLVAVLLLYRRHRKSASLS